MLDSESTADVFVTDSMAQALVAIKPKRKKSNTSTWKSVERAIAKILGGERVPVTGRTRGSAPDIRHEVLSLEVKHGKQIPKLVLEAMDQAEKSVRGNQVPMAIMHPLRAEYSDSICIVRLKDLQKLCDLLGRQNLSRPEDPHPVDVHDPGQGLRAD